MLAAAEDLPPELFARILDYVGTDDAGEGFDWDRGKGDGLRDLKNCSLVCLYWASRCRDILFRRFINVHSLEQLRALNLYASRGSTRLSPLHSHIWGWHILQTWTAHSWCHMYYASSFRKCYTRLRTEHDDSPFWLALLGPLPYNANAPGLHPSSWLGLLSPLPYNVNVFRLHSPHWSLPRSMPACYTPFVHLMLADIRFPSLTSLAKLLRHFRCLKALSLTNITWDKDVLDVVSPAIRTPGVDNLAVKAKGCTDNARICYLAQLCVYSTSSFGQLRAEERDVCFTMFDPPPVHDPLAGHDHAESEDTREDRDRLSSVREISVYSTSTSLINISQRLHSSQNTQVPMDLDIHVFTIPTVPTIPNRPSSTSIAALLLFIPQPQSADFTSYCSALLELCLGQLPSLRLLILSIEDMASAIQPLTRMQRILTRILPATQRIACRFLCKHDQGPAFSGIPRLYGEDTLVEVDAFTIDLTGQTWDGFLGRDALLEHMFRKYCSGFPAQL